METLVHHLFCKRAVLPWTPLCELGERWRRDTRSTGWAGGVKFKNRPVSPICEHGPLENAPVQAQSQGQMLVTETK
jgi:hypothetical protein